MADLGAIKFKRLKQCHPRLSIPRVQMLKALYRGGGHLLLNPAIMKSVFPQYTYENDNVYNERIARAYYENLFAMVVNYVVAGLAQDPAQFDHGDDDTEDSMEDMEDYWTDLLDDATPLDDDLDSRTFDQIMRDQCVEALVCGWSWIQCDLPKPLTPDMIQPTPIPLPEPNKENGAEDVVYGPGSAADQEASGALRAYLVPWGTEQVDDWEDVNGKLLWLRTYQCEVNADDPTKPRDTKRHIWKIYDSEKVTRYEVIEKTGQDPKPLPGDEEMIPVADTTTHTFGRVPWAMLDLCSKGAYLHIGDHIESLCRNYFNRMNAESFQWMQFYYQQLYEFLGPEIPGVDTMVSDAQQDPSRATRRRSPGQVHVRGADDRAEFVGPDMGGAEAGRNALNDLRDGILRITSQMALSQDTSGAMLRRSGDSKQKDMVASEIVIGAIGRRLVIFANQVVSILAAGRQDESWPQVCGYTNFEISDPDSAINRAVLAEGIDIPSATYKIEHKYQAAISELPDLSPDLRAKIRSELEETITQDQITQAFNAPPPNPFGDDQDPDAEDEPDDQDPKDDKEGVPPFPPKKDAA